MGWFPAPVITSIFREVNGEFPHRDKASDGIVGDTSHAARKSEHNPCWTCRGRYYGIVRACDIDIDDGDSGRDMRRMLLKALIGDSRVWYIISNGIIYSRTFGWRPRKYLGTNSHHKHLHISFLFEGCYDQRPFFKPEVPARPTKPVFLDMSDLRDELIRVIDGGKPKEGNIPVKRYQRLLNARLGIRLQIDGVPGPETLAASGRLEKKFGGTGRPRVPDVSTLTRANQGMYRLVA